MRSLINKAHRPMHYHALRLFRVRDGAERAGRGFALGMIVNFFPTFGFGFLISGVLAKLCRGNFIAGLAGGALLTPFWLVLFYMNMVVGGWLMDRVHPITLDQITEATVQKHVWGTTFLVGAGVNSVFFGLIAYGFVTWLMQEHRVAVLKKFRLWRPRKKQNRPSTVLPR
jgi:uncharacterized protein (DUF2062 family)